VGTPSPWKEEKGVVARGGSTSVPIQLNQNDYVEGEIVQSTFTVTIQDPTGKTINDFGYVEQTNFFITALVPGRYNIVMRKDGNSIGASGDFVIKY
jgi:thioredoxin-related protein